MEEKRYIQLEEVIDICEKFIRKEITQKELEEWGNKIEIRLYMPISEKALCVNDILEQCYYSEDKLMRRIQFEMNKFWYILLRYTNINIDNKSLLTGDNYDTIYSVIGYWLLNIVKFDYETVLKMLEEQTMYEYILDISQDMDKIQPIASFDEMKKNIKDMKQILNNPEMIENLAVIFGKNFDIEEK